MGFENILTEAANDGIATITFHRPAKLNALDRRTLDEFEQALNEFQNDVLVRGLILTGAGEKAFIAGADINELASAGAIGSMDTSVRGQRLFRQLELSGKPSVAAINGFALGGGLELAMACTLRVASKNARMGQPEVKLGIIAGYGGTQRLPRLVGRGRALEMLLTGEPVDAAEAWRIGLVNHVVEPADLLPFSRNLLRKVLANGPVSIRLTAAAVDTGLNCGLEEGLRYEAAAFSVSAGTNDCREGTSAFLEKREARFTGK